MNEKQALAKLSKLLGNGVEIRRHDDAPAPVARAAAVAALPELGHKRQAAFEAAEARKKALLEGDAEYQRLVAELRAARAEFDKTGELARFFRYVVCKANRLFTTVEAEGDTLAEVVAKVKAKRS